jgi:hypothetical protein
VLTVKTIEVFTPSELKTRNPKAFERVMEKWRSRQTDWAWGQDCINSLKAVVKACGGKLLDYEIGYYSRLTVDIEDFQGDTDDPDTDRLKDAKWFRDNVLTPSGYTETDERGDPKFPGILPFTGYCADDDFIEAAWEAMRAGETLREALEGLRAVASRDSREDIEQAGSEETMLINWEDTHFTLDGLMVD